MMMMQCQWEHHLLSAAWWRMHYHINFSGNKKSCVFHFPRLSIHDDGNYWQSGSTKRDASGVAKQSRCTQAKYIWMVKNKIETESFWNSYLVPMHFTFTLWKLASARHSITFLADEFVMCQFPSDLEDGICMYTQKLAQKYVQSAGK